MPSTPNTEALKPCPFCGKDTAILDGKSDSCRVRCESCGTEGRPSFFSSDDQDAIDIAEDEARYGWNARVAISTPAAEVAAEPVAWQLRASLGNDDWTAWFDVDKSYFELWREAKKYQARILYTHPQGCQK